VPQTTKKINQSLLEKKQSLV